MEGFRISKKNRLIEDIRGKTIPSDQKKKIEKIPYCLSLNGIFYILLHNPEPFNEKIILSLLQNYGSCLLFTLFLFPFINLKTLLDVKDKLIFWLFI
jgi:hypothetical protein